MDDLPPLPSAGGKVPQLVYLYLSLCHGADADFADEEKKLIVEKVRAWDPLLDKKAAVRLINEVARRYAADRKEGSPAKVRLTIQRLGENLPDEELSQVLSDLVELAQADGMIVEGEWDLIDECKRTWGVLGQ